MPSLNKTLCPACCGGSPKCELTIAVFGVDGAGKTKTIQALKQGECGPVAPTVGFRNEEIRFGGCPIKLYDLGGSRNFRGVWQHYVHEVHAMIYVVDSSDLARLNEVSDAFMSIVSNERFVGKPVLILANKQDLTNAMGAEELNKQTEMKDFAIKSGSHCVIEPCSAIKGHGRTMDRRIKAGLRWLCREIHSNYKALNERMEEDMEEVREVRERENRERRARVMAIREQREKEEVEEKKRLGQELACEDVNEEENVDVTDVMSPFKPLDMNRIVQMEAAEKGRRKKQKDKDDRNHERESQEEDRNASNARVIRVHRNHDLTMSDSEYSDNADIVIPESDNADIVIPSLTEHAHLTPVESCLVGQSLDSANNSFDSLNGMESRSFARDKHGNFPTRRLDRDDTIHEDEPVGEFWQPRATSDKKHARFSRHDDSYRHQYTDNTRVDNSTEGQETLPGVSSPESMSSRSEKRRKRLTPRKNSADIPMNEMNGNASIGTLSKVHVSPVTSDLNTSAQSQTLSRSDNEGSGEGTPPSRRTHRYLKPLAGDSPSETGTKRKKKKKTRLRRNQLSPSDDDTPSVAPALSRPLPPLPWQLNDTMRFPQEERDSGNESVHHNWGFADDLTNDLKQAPRSYRRRPNFGGEDDVVT